MNVDLIKAMIARREFNARDKANRLKKDQTLRAYYSETQHRAVAHAMQSLLQDINLNREST